MLYSLKPFLLLLSALHVFKCLLLFVYNKRKNVAVDFSDFFSYLSAIPKLYIEDGETDLFRKILFGMHYAVLVLWGVLLLYALMKLL
jgi:hypothetical protein